MKNLMILGWLFWTMTACGDGPVELAVIETDFGRIVLQFDEETAPKHVESFKILISEGYFDGTSFHRVIPGFVIQGGDPNTRDEDRWNDGQGGHAGKYYGIGEKKRADSWRLPAEFSESPHVRGALSMARSRDPDSAGSQFFICVDSLPRLDGLYTVFGRVVEGMEVVDKIVSVDTPAKLDPSYQGEDKDNPLAPVTVTVRLATDDELGIEVEDSA